MSPVNKQWQRRWEGLKPVPSSSPRCFTEWSWWTEATFRRRTLRPTSSRSGASSSECAGKPGWSESLTPWSWEPGVQNQKRGALRRAAAPFSHESANGKTVRQLNKKTASPQGHCRWLSREAVNADSISLRFVQTHGHSVRNQEKDVSDQTVQTLSVKRVCIFHVRIKPKTGMNVHFHSLFEWKHDFYSLSQCYKAHDLFLTLSQALMFMFTPTVVVCIFSILYYKDAKCNVSQRRGRGLTVTH